MMPPVSLALAVKVVELPKETEVLLAGAEIDTVGVAKLAKTLNPGMGDGIV